jgi:hypothetical protein
MGVPDAPASLLEPALMLLVALVVPQIITAVVGGEPCPRELAAGIRDRLGGLAGTRRQGEQPWSVPTAQPPWGPTSPATSTGVSSSQFRAAG